MEKFSDNIKKVILAGIGAVAVTAEKSKDLLDEMVEKGELTVEQGKVLNEELKHNIKKTVKETADKKEADKTVSDSDISDLISRMTPEQLAALKEKLAEKELLSVKLYYNLGTYRGNNYEAAVVTARNALKDYPYTEYKEEFEILILRSRYQEALHSVDEKKRERFRNVIDEYYGYTNDFPEGKYIKEANKIFDVAQKYVTD